jgi:pyruvate ferredoxin oxidoreductase beta subunit
MSYQPIRFYQTGTFTVGNRLLPEAQRSVQSGQERTNSLNSGHRACQGCGEALGARYAIDAAMAATNRQLVAANATGCLEVFSTPYPETSWQIPWIHSLFGNAAAVGTGIAAALRAQGKTEVRVVAQGGDGGTTDIGFGCLSGMFDTAGRRFVGGALRPGQEPAADRDGTRDTLRRDGHGRRTA